MLVRAICKSIDEKQAWQVSTFCGFHCKDWIHAAGIPEPFEKLNTDAAHGYSIKRQGG
jgi:hypothetical protein